MHSDIFPHNNEVHFDIKNLSRNKCFEIGKDLIQTEYVSEDIFHLIQRFLSIADTINDSIECPMPRTALDRQ